MNEWITVVTEMVAWNRGVILALIIWNIALTVALFIEMCRKRPRR